MSYVFSLAYKITESLQSSSLQHCQPLQTLNLSGCALTGASTPVITTIVKVSTCFKNI